MGTLACMLKDSGFRVTGSDVASYPPMGEQLRSAGIVIEKGFAAEHVLRERPDLVVIGNAVRRENLEARAAIDSGLPYLSFPDAVRHFFLEAKHSVVIAGTHGKTTSSSIAAWILAHSGRDPSVLVGGVAENFDTSFRLGEGEHFVIEGDEYDTAFFDKTPKFLHYAARSLLLTSCEFDHADIYDSLEEIQHVLRQLVAQIPADGLIIAAGDSPAVRALLDEASAPVETYGFREEVLWKPSDVTFDPNGTELTLWRGSQRAGRLRFPLHGRHNLENVLGAVALCQGLGVEVEESAAALALFKGVRRRQQVRGDAGGVIVVEDFAHHPTAVRETLAAMRARYPDRTLWAVFEPRTHTSRRRFFEDAYIDAFSGADRVVIAGVFRSEEIPEAERMRPERVIDGLRQRQVEAEFHPDVDEIIEAIAAQKSGRDVALIMSNGEFGGIWERLLARLRRAEEA